MQLAKIEEDGKLVLVHETLTRVQAFPKNTKWVVVFGVGRAGKSTLCNLITKSHAFKVSNSTSACTYGVWISEPIPLDDEKQGQTRGEGDKEQEYLVVVDSEGTDMHDSKFQHKILSFSCLLACNGGVLIHNEGHYATTAIRALSTVASSMKLLKGLQSEQFPYLCFLVRNFEAEVEVDGAKATLDDFFRHILSDAGDAFDTDRQLIRQSFPRKTMFTTPPLEKKMRDYLLTNTELPDCDFKTDFNKLNTWLKKVLDVKKVGGLVCDGNVLVTFFELCAKSINEGDYVAIPSVLEMTMDSICSRRAEDAVKVYTDGMAQIQNLSMLEEASLTEIHEKHRQAAIQVYAASTSGYYQISTEKFLVLLDQQISKEYSDTQVNYTRLKTERILKEEQEKREEAERQAQIEKAKREEAERQLAEKQPVGCAHEFEVVNTPIMDYSHAPRSWGGFLHGHHCCGKCRHHVNGRCNNACGGICGKPRQTGTKTEQFCKKCGIKAAG